MQERTKQLQEEEADEVVGRGQRAAHTAAFQKHQASLKQRKLEKERLAKLQDAAMIQGMQTEAEEQFTGYAKEFVAEYARQGKPIVPMQLLLAKPPAFESA